MHAVLPVAHNPRDVNDWADSSSFLRDLVACPVDRLRPRSAEAATNSAVWVRQESTPLIRRRLHRRRSMAVDSGPFER